MSSRHLTAIVPAGIHPPFGNYAHGVLVTPDPACGSPGASWLITSGQLGISKDGAIPDDVEAQAELCFAAIAAILADAGMDFRHVVRLGGYVTRREDFPAYMRVRDRFTGSPPPASTLLVVSGFTRPEMLVEVEAMAVRFDAGIT